MVDRSLWRKWSGFLLVYVVLSVAWFRQGLHAEYAGPAVFCGPPVLLASGTEYIWLYLLGTATMVTVANVGLHLVGTKYQLPVYVFGCLTWLFFGLLGVSPSI